LVSVVKFISERGLAFRDYENVGSSRKFFQKNIQNYENVGSSRKFFQKNIQNFSQAKLKKKEDAMLLVTDFATVSQIANHCQISFAS